MTREFPFPAQLLFGIEAGRYAVSPSDSGCLDFLRLSIVKHRRSRYARPTRYLGWLHIQTQHGDDLISRFYVHPDGAYMPCSAWMPDRIIPSLARVTVAPWEAAMRYGQELGLCARCGKHLTDERSRWYGIGPECEKVWPQLVAEINDSRGAFIPQEEAAW